MSFKETAINTLTKTKDSLVKASPDILVVAGVIGFVGVAVLAAKATLKAGKIIEETKKNLDEIEEAKDLATEEEYSEKDVQKDTALVYAKAAGKFAKLYGPAILLSVASAGMIFKSHGIMKNRLQITASALALTEQLFEQYRNRVKDKYGEEEDEDLFLGIKKKVAEVVNENGEKEEVEYRTSDASEKSPLSVFWGPDYNDYVPKNHVLAVAQLQDVEKEMNYRLATRYGKVYIRDILIRLGYGDDYVNSNPLYTLYGYEHGDKVDFGIHDGTIHGNMEFVMGRTDTCLINFRGAHRLIDFVSGNSIM